MAIGCVNIGDGFSLITFGPTLQPDGKVLIGGFYDKFSGITQNGLIRLNSDGSKDTSFNIGTGFGNPNYTYVPTLFGTKIYVSGQFTTFTGQTNNHLIRLNSDGSKDITFNIGSGFDSNVFSVEVQNDGKVLVGGNFSTFTGQTNNRLIRLNSDGSKDINFNIGSGFGGTVTRTKIQSNNKILVAGWFSTFTGQTNNRLIRLNSDGSKDTTFNIGSGFGGVNLQDIEIQTDGKILAGGDFTTFTGQTNNRLIRLNSDGSKDTSFNIGNGFNDEVASIKIQPDGKILVAGEFTTFTGQTNNNLIRLNPDGSKDTSFNIGLGFSASSPSLLTGIEIDSDLNIYCVGSFTSFNGYPAVRYAKLDTNGNFLGCITPPTQTPTQTQTPTPTQTPTQTQTPTNTGTPTQTPSSPPIICGLGLTTGTYYYTDCCGNFNQGTQVGLEVSFNYTKTFAGITKLNTRTSTVCITPTPTPTPTITPTNTVTPTVTPTNTTTPTPSITPSITPSNSPVTRLKNECDVITLFEMGISCNVIQSPTDSNPSGGVLSLNVTGGTAPYTFLWSGGQRSQTLFGVPADSYEVVVMDYAWPDGSPDYTATTICVLAGPAPSLTPTTTPTPTPTTPVKCVDLCLIAIGGVGVPNFGPIQFVCNGTQNGRFKWTSGGYDIIWNVNNSRWEIYVAGTTTPYVLNGGILASTTFDLIPDSAWTVLGGTEDYSVTMTKGDCPTVIPLQVSIDKTNSSCQGTTNCNGSISILAQDGYPPYVYSINGGITNSSNYVFTNLCPNTYSVVVTDSQNNTQTSSMTIGYDSTPVTYQLSLSNVGVATPTSVPNVSQTVTQSMELVVSPPLPIGVSVTFNLKSTAKRTINSPGTANSTVIWSVTKNGQSVDTVVGPTTVSSQGTRPFCSVNDTQLINSTEYSSSITITNGDVVNVTSTTVDTITNGQVSSQTNCTTNIKTEIAVAILTPTIIGNNCSSVIGSSRQVQTNDFTYVPTTTAPIINYQTAVIINDSDDSGKQYFAPSYDFTSDTQVGGWSYGSGVLTEEQPSFFYTFTLATTSIAAPQDNDTFFMQQEFQNLPNYIIFNGDIGNKMWYLISLVEYTSEQLTTILDNATLIQNMVLIPGTDPKWQGTFIYDLNTTQSNYVYLIWDYRKTTPCIDCVAQDITIGTQIWSKCNLNVTTYRNGDTIPQVTDPTDWANLTTGAWCYYENNSTNGTTYGKLYNWFAVNDPRGLAPVGYHIPTDTEWTTLTTYLGGVGVAGGKMKETGFCHWTTPNTNATNESGFTALPGGSHGEDGIFYTKTYIANFWSSSEISIPFSWYRDLNYTTGNANKLSANKKNGFSVRLIKD